jgi:MFS family permease
MSKSETSIHPRKVLFPLGLGTALSLMGDGTLYTVLPTHTVEAGVALSSVGIILGVNRAVRLFLNGPAGLAYDRWSRRRLFVRCHARLLAAAGRAAAVGIGLVRHLGRRGHGHPGCDHGPGSRALDRACTRPGSSWARR